MNTKLRYSLREAAEGVEHALHFDEAAQISERLCAAVETRTKVGPNLRLPGSHYRQLPNVNENTRRDASRPRGRTMHAVQVTTANKLWENNMGVRMDSAKRKAVAKAIYDIGGREHTVHFSRS